MSNPSTPVSRPQKAPWNTEKCADPRKRRDAVAKAFNGASDFFWDVGLGSSAVTGLSLMIPGLQAATPELAQATAGAFVLSTVFGSVTDAML